MAHPRFIRLQVDHRGSTAQLLQKTVLLGARGGGLPISDFVSGSRLPLDSDSCRLNAHSITQEISEGYRPGDSMGSTLIRIYGLNTLLQADERLMHTLLRKSRGLAAAHQLTLFRGAPLSMAERRDVASQLQDRKGLFGLFCSKVQGCGEFLFGPRWRGAGVSQEAHHFGCGKSGLLGCARFARWGHMRLTRS